MGGGASLDAFIADPDSHLTVSPEPTEDLHNADERLELAAEAVAVIDPPQQVSGADPDCEPEGLPQKDPIQTQASSADTATAVCQPSLAGSSSSASTQPKRFSAVNINKKFLEKASSTSGSNQTSSTSVTAKNGGPPLRPTTQPTTSHSRLVTTKLTTTAPSSMTSTGWSRAPSAPPSAVAPSPSAPITNPSIAPVLASAPGAPQPPHVGKIIQPQPRSAVAGPVPGGPQKDASAGGSNKPVWGNLKVAAAPRPDLKVQSDFPTAAEVAQVNTTLRKAKASDAKEVTETVAASKQARLEEADTFRGVHLDPNAHHWDEMEEDDDNFLDGVIDFGDGRQYTVQPAGGATKTPPPGHSPRLPEVPSPEGPTVPVSKQERFANSDDFDRTWPRSKTSPSIPPRDFPTQRHPPGQRSPALSQSQQSPKEASRVLFNERSNRLEPYASGHPSHRPPQGPQHLQRRGPGSEFATSPVEPINQRDGFPGNVQLLQKQSGAPHDFPPPRGGNFGPLGPPGNRGHPRRDGMPPPMPESKRTGDGFVPHAHAPHGFRDSGIPPGRGRRLSDMGPPPLPPSDRFKDAGRQNPPHLSQAMPPSPLEFRSPSLRGLHSLPPPGPPSAHTGSVHSVSPTLSRPDVLPMSASSELDEVQKDVMQSAAARAKQRRQQEEEERAKAQERARKKAAELAEVQKAKELETVSKAEPDQVVGVIEEAISSVSSNKADAPSLLASSSRMPPPPPIKTSLRGTPSLRGVQRSAFDASSGNLPRRPSISSATSPVAALSPAAQVESWRSKTTPVTPFPPQTHVHARPPIPSFTQSPPPQPPRTTLLQKPEAIDSLSVHSGEELEEVEFSDFGKFVGVKESSAQAVSETLHRNPAPQRQVASDFFDDYGTPPMATITPSRTDVGTWRRKAPDVPIPSNEREHGEGPSSVTDGAELSVPPVVSSLSAEAMVPTDNHHHAPYQRTPSHQGHQRPPRPPYYDKSALTSLDDAMSRIKGAIDGMQSGDSLRERKASVSGESDRSPRKATFNAVSMRSAAHHEHRWIPPVLRTSRPYESDIVPREVFDVSGCEPPRSPTPGWDLPLVRLPSIAIQLDPISKKQLHSAKVGPEFRWDILSWEPPVEQMSKRDFSLNDVLHRKPHTKGKFRYRVLLPRSTNSSRVNPPPILFEGPKVNLPVNGLTPKAAGTATFFGRSSGSDSSPTWRRPGQPTKSPAGSLLNLPESTLDTVSRSPPPESPMNFPSEASLPKVDNSTMPSQRMRSPPKMPEGSGVGFYRGPRIEALVSEVHSSVNFIVGSELEDGPEGQTKGDLEQPQILVSAPNPSSTPSKGGLNADHADSSLGSDLKSQPASPEMGASLRSTTESKGSEYSAGCAPTPPPVHNTSAWTKSPLGFSHKESPARAPDPEHLKAVWNQPSDKARPSVNSLEGIADDLTALPFTLQDVKSEDGETPPPSLPTAPSRMSQHDVTRAFQQVPSPSSSSSGHRGASSSPSSTTLPLARPNFIYPLPPQAPNSAMPMRTGYAPYPSPVMAHSPSPTMIYSHPIAPSPGPTRMAANGHAPLYTHWVPGSGPAPPAVFRPIPSPYPPQIMSYGPGGPVPMYAQQPQNSMQSPPQVNGGPSGRGRGMPVIGQMLPHASHQHPMYSGSPVMMHATAVPVAQGHGYLPVMTPGRGQPANDHVPPPHMQHPPTTNHPQHGGFANVPPTTFASSTW